MPSQDQHIKQYKHNKNFLNNGIRGSSDFPDWVIVVNFYCALHIMEAIFATKDIHNETHLETEENFENLDNCTDVILWYRDLKKLSRKARYQCIKVTDRDIQIAQDNLLSIELFYDKKYEKLL